jgi:hypothetical protein
MDNDEWKDYALSADDFSARLHKDLEDWKKKHPVLTWIDAVLFKGIDHVANYRPSYSITHPWVIIDYVFRKIKHAFQRAFRGWDDTVIWSIDYYLSDMLPVWLRELKNNKTGVPSIFFKENDNIVHENGSVFPTDETMAVRRKEWEEVLDKIIIGFESYNAREEYKFETKEEEAELTRKFEEGFDLLHKYWGCFWD